MPKDYLQFFFFWTQERVLDAQRELQYHLGRLMIFLYGWPAFFFAVYLGGMASDWYSHSFGYFVMIGASIMIMLGAYAATLQLGFLAALFTAAEKALRTGVDAVREIAPGEQKASDPWVTVEQRDSFITTFIALFALFGLLLEITALTPLHEHPMKFAVIILASLIAGIMAIAFKADGFWLKALQRLALGSQVLLTIFLVVDAITNGKLFGWIYHWDEWERAANYTNPYWWLRVLIGLAIILYAARFLIRYMMGERAGKGLKFSFKLTRNHVVIAAMLLGLVLAGLYAYRHGWFSWTKESSSTSGRGSTLPDVQAKVTKNADGSWSADVPVVAEGVKLVTASGEELKLKVGDELSIEATGTANIGRGPVSPEGERSAYRDPSVDSPFTAHIGGLEMWIGTNKDTSRYFVGSRFNQSAKEAGVPTLRIIESLHGYSDGNNSGGFHVTIRIVHK